MNVIKIIGLPYKIDAYNLALASYWRGRELGYSIPNANYVSWLNLGLKAQDIFAV